jgi:predicted phosphodiesterase
MRPVSDEPSFADRAHEAQAVLDAEKAGRDPDLARLETLAERLHARGHDLTLDRGKVVPVRPVVTDTTIDLGKTRYRIGLVSDTHGGSRFEQLSALRSFYEYADQQRVDFFVHAGDLTQGPDAMHKGMAEEVHAHNAESQANYVIGTYPRSQRKRPTYVIGGNHDGSFFKNDGTNIVRRITERRPDMIYTGQDAAYLTVGNLRMYVVHPDGGGAYAKSYKPQKVAESIPNDRRVALAIIGHYHQWGTFLVKDMVTMMLPCFQAQYGWLARKGLYPDLGGVVLDVWLDDDGLLARMKPELIRYRTRENDWDYEVSAAVSRGWSPEGLVA